MPSADFTKICKELSSINESSIKYQIFYKIKFNKVTISTSKDSVRFSV
jgi:hypothetical protein